MQTETRKWIPVAVSPRVRLLAPAGLELLEAVEDTEGVWDELFVDPDPTPKPRGVPTRRHKGLEKKRIPLIPEM